MVGNQLIDFEFIARQVILKEIDALKALASCMPKDFPEVIRAILSGKGRVVLTGIGKSGYIARKIAASLASTGTPAFYVHPAEASHGDLGMITKDDIVIMLSNSGETKELIDIIRYCKRFDIKIAGVTSKESSNLAQNSDFLLILPVIAEASSLGAPTSSALMMLSLGDALVVALHEARSFTKQDYLTFHPGGQIGNDLKADLYSKKSL